ncbi:VOC family protein [Nocardia sp. NPDC050697]|uniref:VOC family protein n=1 Tax=Nocardia sp. NPDC050697 TaxID=3155158 RepID=UPI0033E545F1
MPDRDTPWPPGTPCWVDCQVDDTQQAAAFYGALFGWEIEDGGAESGGYLMARRNDRAAAGIGPKPPEMAMPSVWTTYIATDSADRTAAAVTESGGGVLVPPFDVMDVGRMLVAADPTGAAFGVWEARAHHGAGIYNEHGAYCWNELHTDGYRRAQEFYTGVFGWAYAEIGDGENFVYSTFSHTPDGPPLGGVNEVTAQPSYWLTWFQVDDTDATLRHAADLGATVLSGPDDSPFGRMGVLRGPQDEVFAVIDPNRTAGTPPGT